MSSKFTYFVYIKKRFYKSFQAENKSDLMKQLKDWMDKEEFRAFKLRLNIGDAELVRKSNLQKESKSKKRVKYPDGIHVRLMSDKKGGKRKYYCTYQNGKMIKKEVVVKRNKIKIKNKIYYPNNENTLTNIRDRDFSRTPDSFIRINDTPFLPNNKMKVFKFENIVKDKNNPISFYIDEFTDKKEHKTLFICKKGENYYVINSQGFDYARYWIKIPNKVKESIK